MQNKIADDNFSLEPTGSIAQVRIPPALCATVLDGEDADVWSLEWDNSMVVTHADPIVVPNGRRYPIGRLPVEAIG